MRLVEKLASLPDKKKYVAFGRVESVRGMTVIARGPDAAIGDLCRVVRAQGRHVLCEVVGFQADGRLILTAYDEVRGIHPGAMVTATGRRLEITTGKGVLGRLLDGLGRAADGLRDLTGPLSPLEVPPIAPLARRPIAEPLWTGIRAIDGLMTLGIGQRMGIFAGAGVGKTMLLQSLLAGMTADVAVVALIGERGREVAEFYQSLSPQALSRTVVVAATSDSPAIMRLRAVDTASVLADGFRQDGKNVALVVDSLTRVAMAQREIGLEAGEFPSARGYTPSVFHLLPRLLERAGRVGDGAVTGIYTVLLDGDDPADPIGDAVRGLLDGAIYLSRGLAERQHFPAIDVPKSLSRTMGMVVSQRHAELAARARRILARLARSADLLEIGAYAPGSDPELDEALQIGSRLQTWLRQTDGDSTGPEDMLDGLQDALEGAEPDES